MRVLRSIFIALLFIAGVFVASANVHLVELFYLPAADLAGWPAQRSVAVPLFLVVIVTLVAGVLLGGLAAILEQVRLRTGLRRANKERDRAVTEQGNASALLDTANSEIAGLKAEVAELREELRTVGELEIADEPLSAFLDAPEIDVEAATSAPDGPDDADSTEPVGDPEKT